MPLPPAASGRVAARGKTPSGKAPVRKAASSNVRVAPDRPVVSTGMTERLAERASMRRHRRRVRLVATLVVLVVVAGGIWTALFSPVLALDTGRVSITGQGSVIDVDAVSRVVAPAQGVPLPRLDTVGMRSQILKLSGVKDVSISRDWPRGLTIELVAREPVAAVPVDGKYALVDVEAVAVQRVDDPPANLPVISLAWAGDAKASRPLKAALVLLAALPPELRAEVGEVSAATQDDVEMVLRDGVRIRWGGAQDAALKVKVFQTLRALPENAGVKEYDVSAPTTPVTR